MGKLDSATGAQLRTEREAAEVGPASLARAMGYGGKSAHTNVWHIEQRSEPSAAHVIRYRSALALIRRFWSKVERRGADECWLWTGAVTRRGYGHMTVENRERKATHVSLFLATGRWPEPGMFACHRCDTPACVNPAHLFVGTASDNTRDAQRKGRFSRRLTPEQVGAIHEARAAGRGVRELAREYGVSPALVSRMVRGQRRGLYREEIR